MQKILVGLLAKKKKKIGSFNLKFTEAEFLQMFSAQLNCVHSNLGQILENQENYKL